MCFLYGGLVGLLFAWLQCPVTFRRRFSNTSQVFAPFVAGFAALVEGSATLVEVCAILVFKGFSDQRGRFVCTFTASSILRGAAWLPSNSLEPGRERLFFTISNLQLSSHTVCGARSFTERGAKSLPHSLRRETSYSKKAQPSSHTVCGPRSFTEAGRGLAPKRSAARDLLQQTGAQLSSHTVCGARSST